MHDDHSNEFSSVQQLISLKRHEQPEDAYFEEFLQEFQRRQRQELLQRSSFSLFKERVGTWFADTNKWNFVWGGGLAYAVLLLGFVLWPKSVETLPTELPNTHIKHETPKPAKDMLEHDKEKKPVHEAY